MIKVMLILTLGAVVAITAGCANGRPGGATAQSAAAEKDYERLSGTWQLTRGVVNGRPVPASVLRNTVLVTDRNIFRFPKEKGIGTHPAGHFTVNPNTRPKQVDSIAEGGPEAGEMTPGIIRDPRREPQTCLLGTPWWTAADRIRIASGKQTDSSILEEDWSGAVPLILLLHDIERQVARWK
jgi:uncharacterized protein (TIGR03067 family)